MSVRGRFKIREESGLCICDEGFSLHLYMKHCEPRDPVQGSKSPKSGKEGPGKRRFESENPLFSTGAGPCRENGDFLTRNALFWGEGKWGFFGSETLFS